MSRVRLSTFVHSLSVDIPHLNLDIDHRWERSRPMEFSHIC